MILTLILACTTSSTEPEIGGFDACRNQGTDGATATCLSPTKDPAHYVAQAEKYFDTLDLNADRSSIPDYHPQVIRWEWEPWLLLTGYTADNMHQTADILRVVDPSTVPVRDCRFFDTQPFARCYITFDYKGKSCPIYEEFVFNDAGQMTFIEAWSDIDGLRPHTEPADRWGEHHDIGRMSTRVPGLGNSTGTIDTTSQWMTSAADSDPELSDLIVRTEDFWGHWAQALEQSDPDFFAIGCGWDLDTAH